MNWLFLNFTKRCYIWNDCLIRGTLKKIEFILRKINFSRSCVICLARQMGTFKKKVSYYVTVCWWNAEMYKQYLYSLGKSNFCSNNVGKQQLSMDNVMGKSINSNCKVTNERQPGGNQSEHENEVSRGLCLQWPLICSTGFFLVQFHTRLSSLITVS